MSNRYRNESGREQQLTEAQLAADQTLGRENGFGQPMPAGRGSGGNHGFVVESDEETVNTESYLQPITETSAGNAIWRADGVSEGGAGPARRRRSEKNSASAGTLPLQEMRRPASPLDETLRDEGGAGERPLANNMGNGLIDMSFLGEEPGREEPERNLRDEAKQPEPAAPGEDYLDLGFGTEFRDVTRDGELSLAPDGLTGFSGSGNDRPAYDRMAPGQNAGREAGRRNTFPGGGFAPLPYNQRMETSSDEPTTGGDSGYGGAPGYGQGFRGGDPGYGHSFGGGSQPMTMADADEPTGYGDTPGYGGGPGFGGGDPGYGHSFGGGSQPMTMTDADAPTGYGDAPGFGGAPGYGGGPGFGSGSQPMTMTDADAPTGYSDTPGFGGASGYSEAPSFGGGSQPMTMTDADAPTGYGDAPGYGQGFGTGTQPMMMTDPDGPTGPGDVPGYGGGGDSGYGHSFGAGAQPMAMTDPDGPTGLSDDPGFGAVPGSSGYHPEPQPPVGGMSPAAGMTMDGPTSRNEGGETPARSSGKGSKKAGKQKDQDLSKWRWKVTAFVISLIVIGAGCWAAYTFMGPIVMILFLLVCALVMAILFATGKLAGLKKPGKGNAPAGKGTMLLRATNTDRNYEIRIRDQEVMIGREKENCDFALNLRGISRAHCVIRPEKRSGRTDYFIRDCRSKNGTFLNGRKLGENYTALHEGDRISLAGQYDFIVHLM